MTNMKSNVEQITQIVNLIKDNKDVVGDLLSIATPVLSELTKTIIDSIGPELSNVAARIEVSSVDIKKKIFDKYIDSDFTRDEAIAFMLSDGSKLSKFQPFVDSFASTIKIKNK